MLLRYYSYLCKLGAKIFPHCVFITEDIAGKRRDHWILHSVAASGYDNICPIFKENNINIQYLANLICKLICIY